MGKYPGRTGSAQQSDAGHAQVVHVQEKAAAPSPLFSFTNFMKRSRGKGKAVCMGAICVLHAMTRVRHAACCMLDSLYDQPYL
jgi:hypothetical protein